MREETERQTDKDVDYAIFICLAYIFFLLFVNKEKVVITMLEMFLFLYSMSMFLKSKQILGKQIL